MKSFNKINTTRFNRTIKTLALGAVVAMTCSCEDFLTIYPTDKVVLENYWKTKTDVENVVANSYRMMLLPEFTERLIVWGELRGDNVIEGNYYPNKHGNIKNINFTRLDATKDTKIYRRKACEFDSLTARRSQTKKRRYY